MKQLRIDFTSAEICPDGYIAGRIGEHKATELIITPPAELSANESTAFYCLAFLTGNKLIHSELFAKSETLSVELWQQLTQNEVLQVQLEAYDGEQEYIGKSATVLLRLLPSLCGDDVASDTDNPDLVSEVAANSLARHSHSNKETLDKFSTNEEGKPLFDGVEIESKDGYTPQKGIDYWTDEDKAEIKSYVDEAILGGEW